MRTSNETYAKMQTSRYLSLNKQYCIINKKKCTCGHCLYDLLNIGLMERNNIEYEKNKTKKK